MTYEATVWGAGTLVATARLRNMETQHEEALVSSRAASGNPLLVHVSSSAPAVVASGVYFNTVDNNLYASDGVTWRKVRAG